MPAKPRSATVDPYQVAVYHCSNRIVQRRCLFGWDKFTRRDYSERKNWVRDRLRQLASGMAIEVLDYGILDNHLHVILRSRPDVVATWSDEEVARRWWRVCPKRRRANGTIPDPKPAELLCLIEEIDVYRRQLSDISWMMRLACQTIARRANKEDEVDGRFFAKRFDCDRLETVADVLNCCLYVDLNPVRAGIADTPEESRYTAAYDRIQARWQRLSREMADEEGRQEGLADDWLAPIFLDERADAYVSPRPYDAEPTAATASGQHAAPQSEPGELAAPAPDASPQPGASRPAAAPTTAKPAFCNPLGAPRLTDKGFLPIKLDQYLELLDKVGRIVKAGKRGAIPAGLPPILERLGLNAKEWLDTLLDTLGVAPAPDDEPAAELAPQLAVATAG